MPKSNESFYSFHSAELDIPWLVAGGFHRRCRALPLPEHRHCEGIELTFVSAGAVRWVLSDGPTLYHPAGTLGVIQRNVRHHGDSDVIAPCGLFWLLIAPERLGEKFFTAEEARSMRENFESAGNLVVEGNEFFPVALKRLIQLFQDPEAYEFSGRLRLLLHTLLLESAASLQQARQRQARHRLDAWKMQQVKEALASDLSRRIRLAELARRHGMTPVELTRRFMRYEKLTPAEFRMRTRLTRATHELKTRPERAVGELALALGFSSGQHFANAFKRYYGNSPSEYRANGA